MSTTDWIKRGRHLPRFLRDFHDQKGVFKAIERNWGRPEEPHRISWIDGHVYVIDFFLRFMAYHGYTLQKTRTKVETHDLAETIRNLREAEAEEFLKALDQHRAA